MSGVLQGWHLRRVHHHKTAHIHNTGCAHSSTIPGCGGSNDVQRSTAQPRLLLTWLHAIPAIPQPVQAGFSWSRYC
jgi:hypothetical protein